jgi:hypothetical protein
MLKISPAIEPGGNFASSAKQQANVRNPEQTNRGFLRVTQKASTAKPASTQNDEPTKLSSSQSEVNPHLQCLFLPT